MCGTRNNEKSPRWSLELLRWSPFIEKYALLRICCVVLLDPCLNDTHTTTERHFVFPLFLIWNCQLIVRWFDLFLFPSFFFNLLFDLFTWGSFIHVTLRKIVYFKLSMLKKAPTQTQPNSPKHSQNTSFKTQIDPEY